MADSKFERLHLRGNKADCIGSPCCNCLAGHAQAQPYVIRQHIVAIYQHFHVFRRDRHEFGRDDPSVGNTGRDSLVSIEVATEIGKAHFGGRHLVLLKNGVDEEVRQRSWGCHRNRFSLEIFDLGDR